MSNEHVWPDWVRNELTEDERKRPVNYGFRDSVSGEVRHARFLPFDLKVKDVCEDCNTRWMSDLENAVASFVRGMLKGGGRHLHERGQTTLAAWAVLKVLVAQRTFPQNSPIPAEHYRAIHDSGQTKDPPPDVFVFTSRVPCSEGQMDYGFFQLNGLVIGEPQDENRTDGYIATLTILDLAVHVFWPFNRKGGRFIFPPQVSGSIRQIWPSLGSFVWPPGPALTRRGLRIAAGGEARRKGV